MNRIFKILFYLFTSIILIVGVLLVLISSIYSDEIEENVIKNIRSNIDASITLKEIDFTLWEQLPYASVKFTDLTIYEDTNFIDTLIYAQNAFMNLSLIDVALKKYQIKTINLDHAKLNIRYDDNMPNYKIFGKDTTQNNTISIQKLVLNNTQIDYKKQNINTSIKWKNKKTEIDFNKNGISLNSHLIAEYLRVGKINYLKDKECYIKGSLQIKDQKIDIKNTDLLIENVMTKLEGSILKNNQLDLIVSANKQQLKSIILHLPENLQKICAPFITDGIFNCTSYIKGSFTKNSSPFFNMDFNISNGLFELKSKPVFLNNITLKGKINNGETCDFKNTTITVSSIQASTKNGNIKGDFVVRNLNQPSLNANLNSSWELSELNKYFQDSPFFKLSGRFIANTKYNGRLSFNSNFKNHFLDAYHQTSASFKNVFFKYLDSPLDFNIYDMKFNLENNILNIYSSNINIGESNLNFNGEITNFIKYLIYKTPEININGDLNSNKLILQELITLNKTGESQKTKRSFPSWIKLKLTNNIDELIYDDFKASLLKGEINYNNYLFSGKKLTFNALEGKINLDFVLTEPTNKYIVLKTSIGCDKINIRNAFNSFNNFNQQFIDEEEINGIGTAEINIESHWKPDYIFDDKKLKIKSHLIIEKGELIDFKPLENLSTFISLNDLKHVKFSTLENTIEVKDRIVNIPDMEIKSSALSVYLSGKHTFEQEIDYNIQLLLSELLSSTFRQKNKNSSTEFGEIKEDGEVFTTVYLKMKGNTNNPKITFDGLRIKEDLEQGITKEVKILQDIIKEDILQNEKKKEKEKGDDVIIEWEENNKYNPK